jgi:hypothetical protein
VTRPKIKSLCEGLTSPKCYYVDLRESWNGHPEYTSDGIHPTNAGDKASAKQIWDVMVRNCVAQRVESGSAVVRNRTRLASGRTTYRRR